MEKKQQQIKHKSNYMEVDFRPQPEGLAVWVRVFEAHLLQFAATVEFIVARVCLLPQVLHVHSDQHFSQFHKVTVILVLHCQRHSTETHALLPHMSDGIWAIVC